MGKKKNKGVPYNMKSLSIGDVHLRNPVFLAPLAGYTDQSFRALCHEFGAGFTFSEMVSAKSVVYGNVNTKKLLDNDSRVRPWAVQFFGHEPDVFYKAIRRLEGWPFDVVDINMGCPVPKIVKNGEGCALMNDPALAGRIIEAAVKASTRPVTVKIRKGFTYLNAAEMAKVAQESGAACVTVHGRTRGQFYAGAADWSVIGEVKAAVKIPVIGNGDVVSPQTAERMLTETGCDGVMVARGALGNPWIFKQTTHYLETGELLPPPEWEEKRDTALAHLRALVAHKGETAGVPEMRKHLSFYIKGLPDASEKRRRINELKKLNELEEFLLSKSQK
jgi:nifR3 family TIM-barrel protein